MLDAMSRLIQDQAMLSPGSTVLCAVSGGADSICLLHALYHLRSKLGFRLAAAHYNHNLRGEESQGDAAFVAQFVALCCGPCRLSDGTCLPAVSLYTGSGDVAGEAERQGTGLEETARAMRYRFLRQTARAAGADVIATAHNAGDNVETILFHLARGAGLRGLSGIRPVGDGLIRPLLTTSRSEIEEYLAYYGLPCREDRSNRDTTYTRNRIRHQVIPVLEELCPGFVRRLGATAGYLRADEDLLEAQAGALAGQAVPREGGLSLPAACLAQAPSPLALRAVAQLMERLNGGCRDCSASHLQAVLALCRSTDPSARADLPGGLVARRVYQALVLTRYVPAALPDSLPLPLPGRAQAGDWQILCRKESYAGQPQGPREFWLDCGKVAALILRSRRTGDRLCLPGRPEKTVKKWLIDEKIPAHTRDALPLLVLPDGQPAAAAGLGPHAPLLPAPGAPAWHITLALCPAESGLP